METHAVTRPAVNPPIVNDSRPICFVCAATPVAGSSIAAALAPAGVSVLVLERQTTYRDKVRGEYMQPWGVAEMLRLGLEQPLLEAGALAAAGPAEAARGA